MSQGKNSRAIILATATKVFVECEGDITLNDIARRADLSVAVVYQYFSSEAELIVELIADFYERYDRAANAPSDLSLSWRERERRRLSRMVQFLFSEPLAPMILGSLSSAAEIAELEAQRRAILIEIEADNIRGAQARGEIDPELDAELAAAIINGGVRQAVSMALMASDRPTPARFEQQTWRMIAGSLGFTPDASRRAETQLH